MTPSYLIYGVGVMYVLTFTGLSLLRRERFSPRFVIEGLAITAAAYAAVRWGGISFHPVLFLLLLYLVTMRVRLLVELGNLFSKWEQYPRALGVYRLGLKLFPDRPARLMTLINVGATYLKLQMPEKTVELLEGEKDNVRKQLGPKHVAGCSYNLGMAYRRCGRYDEALRRFQEVADIFPLSRYAVLAGKAISETRMESGLVPPVPKPE